MKKIILALVLLGINTTYAQFILDFESIMKQKVGGNTDKIIAYIDTNPLTNGVNSSKYAVKVTELIGTEFWGSTIVNKLYKTVWFEDGRHFSIDFFSPKSTGMITLKIKGGVEEDFIYSGKANTWRTAIFNFSNAKKSVTSDKIEIFFDVRDHNNPKRTSSRNLSEENYWFDNIVQSKRRIRPKK